MNVVQIETFRRGIDLQETSTLHRCFHNFRDIHIVGSPLLEDSSGRMRENIHVTIIETADYPNYVGISREYVGTSVVAVPGGNNRYEFIESGGDEEWKIRLIFGKEGMRSFITSLENGEIERYITDFDFFHPLYEEARRRGMLSIALLARTAERMRGHTPLEYHYELLDETGRMDFLEGLVEYIGGPGGDVSSLIPYFVLEYIGNYSFDDSLPVAYRLYLSIDSESIERADDIKDNIVGTWMYSAEDAEDVTAAQFDMLDNMFYDWIVRRNSRDYRRDSLQRYLDFAPLRCELVNRFLASIGETAEKDEKIDNALFHTLTHYIEDRPSDCYDGKLFDTVRRSQNQ